MLSQLAEWTKLVLEIACGIGCIILIHEFGHFVMAKLHKVRVEVFSIGIGPAICSWRRGLGFRRGSTVKEYEEILRAEKEGIQRRDPHALGETEYRLAWFLPLGGFVRMAGESPFERTGDPNELGAKPPGARLQIFVAGALMNLLLTFPICVLMYRVGIVEAIPVVGDIAAGSAEWKSGMQKDDVILEVNGRPVRSIQEYREVAILADPKTLLDVKVLRPPAGPLPRWDEGLAFSPDGKACTLAQIAKDGPVFVRHPTAPLHASLAGAREVTVHVTTAGSEGYGVSAFGCPVVGAVMDGSEAQKAGLQPGDMILEANGTPLRGFNHLQDILRESAGKPVALKVRSADGRQGDLSATPAPVTTVDLDVDEVMPPVAGSIKGGSPGEAAKIEAGDRFLSVNGKEVPSWSDLVSTIHAMPGKAARIRLLRKDREIEVEATLGTDPEMGWGSLGIAPHYGNEVARVPAGSPWSVAGFQKGDVIKGVAGREVEGLVDLENHARKLKAPEPIAVTVLRGGREVGLTVLPVNKTIGLLGFEPRMLTVEKQYPWEESLTTGLGDGARFIKMTVLMFKKLVLGHESAKGLAGPVGIVKASYQMAREGFGKLLWFLALITVSLGVFNLLPIPILDGWYVLLLVVEKLRGKPVSEQAFYRSQIVGLALIVSLILFVTYNDITR